MASFRESNLSIVMNGAGKKQSAIHAPFGVSDFDTVVSINNEKTFPALTENTEEIYDCTGEDIIFERVNSRFARVTLNLNPTGKVLAPFFAYLLGQAAAPTGAPANEQQTVTVTATGGSYTLELDFEGVVFKTQPIA